jgi:hypothetical protein
LKITGRTGTAHRTDTSKETIMYFGTRTTTALPPRPADVRQWADPDDDAGSDDFAEVVWDGPPPASSGWSFETWLTRQSTAYQEAAKATKPSWVYSDYVAATMPR